MLVKLRPRGPVPLWRQVLGNVSARVIAIVGLTVATVMVARAGGASAVGSYALLRMLPGLFGVLAVLGLPGAMAYFLSPARENRSRLWPTIAALAAAGAVVGTMAWMILVPLLQRAFFRLDTDLVVAAAGLTVSTQLVITLGKTALQGLEDRRGADLAIAAEEVAFLPLYAVTLMFTGPGSLGVVYALIGADLVVGLWAWWRVARALHWRRGGLAPAPHGFWNRPDPRLARTIASYGIRGQVGGLLTLLNTRLDFAILAAMSGPAVLGSYAVASKYAELLRLPSLALTWIAYPRLAKLDDVTATRRAVAMARPALAVVALAAVPVFVLAGPVTRLLYGDGFDSAVLPAHILIAGMVLSGGAGAASGFLYSRGRPGLNSTVLAVGLGITVVLDLLLIPPYAAVGAAVASAVAYLTSDGVLLLVLARMSHRVRRPDQAETGHALHGSTAEVSR